VVLPILSFRGIRPARFMKILAEDCDLHTVLRLPRGTFTPCSQGVKANVILFTKGYATETVWITTRARTCRRSRRRTARLP